MKKLSKIGILSFLIILSISFASASDLDNDNNQYCISENIISENNIQEISIDEASVNQEMGEDISLNEKIENKSSFSNSKQFYDVNYDVNYKNSDLSYKNCDASYIDNINNNYNDYNNYNNYEVFDSRLVVDNEINEKNSQKGLLSLQPSGNIHKLSPSNYSRYFKNSYVNTSIVKSGDIIDLSGNFNKVNFTFTIPCSITSSLNDAYLTNCVIKYENLNSTTYSNVSNLKFTTDIEKHPSVYIVYSSHVNVFNCNAYSTGANSNPTLLVGSRYCNIHHNVFETTFTGYMNMSWKRAGILLGESHYNNIYSNFVTVKDSNPIYLTTYGFDKSNYNNIYNNTVTSSAISEETGLHNPSAWAYGIHIMGDYNSIINNTIYNLYRGVDSEGSFNQIIGNKIYNLVGSYYEGNNGTDGGDYGIHASYSNVIINNTIQDSKITGSAIYISVNCTALDNVIQNISGANAIEFSISGSNTLVDNNLINMTSGNGIYIRGNMTNVTLSKNIISSPDATAILIKALSKAKYPDFIIIENNMILDFNRSAIDFSDIESKANISSLNNSIIITNATFFNTFDNQGFLKNQKSIDYILFKGIFSNLPIDSITINQNISILGLDSQIMDIPFIINSSNIKIENISLNIGKSIDAFYLDNVENISFINNTIIVDSKNYALVLNNSKISMLDNFIIINDYNPAILNDNASYILYGENIIQTLFDIDILSLNDSIFKITVYIVGDDNYNSLFNSEGKFYDDFDITIGDTLKIANLTNKTIRIDIPLIISSYKDSIINNSTIILEDMASNASITNLKFKLENNSINKDFSFIRIKDGVSNLIIANNQFYVSNISGEASLSAVKILGFDEGARNIKLLNNIFNLSADSAYVLAISVLNEGLDNYNGITDALSILNNDIYIYNSHEDGLAYGINIVNSNNLEISSNNVYSNGNTAFGVYISKVTNYIIKENLIDVSGFNYQKFIHYLNSIDFNNGSYDFNIASYISENLTNTDSAIYVENCQNPVLRTNELYENGALVNVIHSNNPSQDIQNIIKSSSNGDIIYLGNNVYSIKYSLIINKSISLVGGTLVDNIDSSGGGLLDNINLENNDPLFIILPKSNLQNTVNLLNMTVIFDNNDLFVLSLLKNSTNPIDIDYPIINIKNNTFLKMNNELDGESINLIKSIAERALLKFINNINLENNNLIENMNQIRYYLFNDSSSNEINFKNGIKTIIVSNNLVCTALDKDIYGNSMKYFEAKLLDENNNPLASKSIYISYNNAIYNLISDSNGIIKLAVGINTYGIYNLLISFLGDSRYGASFSGAKLTVNKQKASLTVPNKSYLVTANKYLTATFKDINGKAIKNKKISFILNGKTYRVYTNSKGVATVKVKISAAKTYTVTVNYEGDSVYSSISKSSKFYIKKISTKLIVKNRSYKKSKKIKKLTATLKTKSGKAIAKKKLTFIVNGKKYTVKTNKNGVATFKVNLPKKKTYKLRVKFAGDNIYLKASKKAKVKIK